MARPASPPTQAASTCPAKRPKLYEDVHGLTARETAAVDRLEAGDDRDTVAADVGMSRVTIDVLAQRYLISGDMLGGFDRMVRRGDARLQRALAASGGRFA